MQPREAARFVQQIEAGDTSVDQADLAEAILAMCDHWTSTMTGLGMKGELGAADWSASELQIWELGESLRPYLKRRQWRGQGPLLDSVARVAMTREFGKGRQTHVLLLGDFGNRDYGAVLGALVDDAEVCGHAIKALRSARIGGYANQVRDVLSREQGWIRKAARRYLKDVEGAAP